MWKVWAHTKDIERMWYNTIYPGRWDIGAFSTCPLRWRFVREHSMATLCLPSSAESLSLFKHTFLPGISGPTRQHPQSQVLHFPIEENTACPGPHPPLQHKQPSPSSAPCPSLHTWIMKTLRQAQSQDPVWFSTVFHRPAILPVGVTWTALHDKIPWNQILLSQCWILCGISGDGSELMILSCLLWHQDPHLCLQCVLGAAPAHRPGFPCLSTSQVHAVLSGFHLFRR